MTPEPVVFDMWLPAGADVVFVIAFISLFIIARIVKEFIPFL